MFPRLEIVTGAQEALTITDTGITQTETFDIEGDSFRITSDVENTNEDSDLFSFAIFVQDETDVPAAIVSQEEPGTKTSFVNEGPGEFSLEISGANASYTVLVEDCSGDNGTEGDAEDSDNTGDDTDNDGTDEDEADDDVIDDSVPDKDLPETGGIPLLGVAFFMFAGAGLLTAVVRRRR